MSHDVQGETVLKGLKRLGGNKGQPGQKGGQQNGGRGGKQGRGQVRRSHIRHQEDVRMLVRSGRNPMLVPHGILSRRSRLRTT